MYLCMRTHRHTYTHTHTHTRVSLQVSSIEITNPWQTAA